MVSGKAEVIAHLRTPHERRHTMKIAATLILSSLIVLTLAAFSAKDRSTRPLSGDTSSYLAEIHGAVNVNSRGEAEFGVVKAREGSSDAFILSLGAHSPDGSVLFTRSSGGPLAAGIYTVVSRDSNPNQIQALIMTGSLEHPTGVFWAESGSLIVTSASDSLVSGRFQVRGTGFLASNPNDENETIGATGTFTASRH